MSIPVIVLRYYSLAIALAVLGVTAHAAGPPDDVVVLTPLDLKWETYAKVKGIHRALVFGDPMQSGPYVYRVQFPANFRIEAHRHPDTRTYTVLSGTWYVGWGDRLDANAVKPLPPGSAYIKPANVAHFALTRGPVEIQISGTGPTRVDFVDTKK